MIDLKWAQNNRELFEKAIKSRNLDLDTKELFSIANLLKEKQMLLDSLRHDHKEKSTAVHSLDKSSNEYNSYVKDAKDLKIKIDFQTEEINNLQEKLDSISYYIPNIIDESVPYGLDETMNPVIKEVGNIRDGSFLEHFEVGVNLGLMDFEVTSKICGSRFVTLSGDLVRLYRALKNFMCDIHVNEFGFREIFTPYIVSNEAMYNAGQLPKFDEESYKIGDKHRLIPTAEVPIVNMFADSILDEAELPIRYVGYTECFRLEAGSAGKDTKGMIRNHQFGKVELVSATTAEDSEREHEFILNSAESILKKLDIPYRVVLLCSGDIGFGSAKTYDIEVWLPGQGKYREISSVSNCKDFQSRRMRARYKSKANKFKGTKLLHTLNGSALAIGRALVAVIENYQNSDGSITVPEVLRKYMGDIEFIRASKCSTV